MSYTARHAAPAIEVEVVEVTPIMVIVGLCYGCSEEEIVSLVELNNGDKHFLCPSCYLDSPAS